MIECSPTPTPTLVFSLNLEKVEKGWLKGLQFTSVFRHVAEIFSEKARHNLKEQNILLS